MRILLCLLACGVAGCAPLPDKKALQGVRPLAFPHGALVRAAGALHSGGRAPLPFWSAMPVVTLEDYFGRFSAVEPPSDEVRANAAELIAKVNVMLRKLEHIPAARSPKVNSGWRPASYNATVPGAAVKSKHITGQAIDLADPDGELDEYLLANQQVLIEAGLFLEHPLATKNWTHVQSVPPRSGNRVFFP